MKTLRLFVVVLLATLSTAVYANHSWGSYHWARKANPFTLKLGSNFDAPWVSYLGTTSTDWTASSVLDTVIVPGLAGRNCKPTLGRVEVCNSKYGNNGWLGIAQVWVSGSHITQGTVKMNDTYFTKPAYNTVAWKNLVLCQEVGHTFGLDHQDESFSNANLGTCMDYTNLPESNQHPNAHDFEQLLAIYAHLDTTTTVASVTPQEMKDVEGDGPPQWGKVLRKDAKGNASVYERDFGKGHKVFTFVVWADPAAESH